MNASEICCSKCILKEDCGYIGRGLTRKCSTVQDFEEGFDAAVEKAIKWLRLKQGYTIGSIHASTKIFEQYMNDYGL